MALKVRFALKEDIYAIARLYKGWLEYKDVLPEALAEPDKEEDLLKHFKKGSIRKYVVAELNEKIIGVCYIDLSFLSLNTTRLGDMLVDKNYRGEGFGTAIVRFVIDYARQNKVRKIWLWAQEELTEGIALYKKLGFIFEGRQKSQFCGKDALLFGLVLE